MVQAGEGCPKCRHTGLYGRSGVFEMLDVQRRVRQLITEGKDANEIAYAARVEDTVFAATRLAFSTTRPVAVLIGQRVVGFKDWSK